MIISFENPWKLRMQKCFRTLIHWTLRPVRPWLLRRPERDQLIAVFIALLFLATIVAAAWGALIWVIFG